MRTLLTIALASFVCAAPAAAAPADGEFSVAISYGDLNLSSAAGVAKLLGRVKARANMICVGASDSPLAETLQEQKCRKDFIRTAERTMQVAFVPASSGRAAGR